MRTSSRRKLWVAVISLGLGICLSVPALAGATTVANGNFETGTLEDWSTFSNKVGTGKWYAYSGTTTPIGPSVPPPPDGTYGAISAQGAPGTYILYQDLYVSPGTNETLSMVTYFESHAMTRLNRRISSPRFSTRLPKGPKFRAIKPSPSTSPPSPGRLCACVWQRSIT